jgi:hypothetical protein
MNKQRDNITKHLTTKICDDIKGLLTFALNRLSQQMSFIEQKQI